jgi:platelet-activating factor acetylhydrolase
MRIEPVVHPRWTWRYVLCCGVATYLAYCTLFSSPLLSSNLPAYTGPHEVGLVDIEVPVDHRTIHNATLKDGTPAFKMETILFSLYYPAVKGVKSHGSHLWMPRPLSIIGAGYAKYAHFSNFVTNSIFTFSLWLLVGSTKIPAKVDVPLLQQRGEFPVMVFSHGMASSRTQYTHYAGELASRGYVVAAIEHRDGSGPGTQIIAGNSIRTLLHFSDGEAGIDCDTYKQAQLDFRQAEVEETVRVLRRLNDGGGEKIHLQNSRHEGRDLGEWTGRLSKNTTIGGHSFGATLAMQVLKGGSSDLLPFGGAVALDPGKQSGQLNSDIRVPTLILHSNSWSKQRSIFFGRPHFDVVKDIVQSVLKRGKDAWFMTSRKSISSIPFH